MVSTIPHKQVRDYTRPVRTSAYALADDQREAIEMLAAIDGHNNRSMTVREALDEYIARRRNDLEAVQIAEAGA